MNAYRTWRTESLRRRRDRREASPMRPYDLRHSFASLLIAEGRSILEVAEQLGHAPTMTLDVYGHVIAELLDRRSAPRRI